MVDHRNVHPKVGPYGAVIRAGNFRSVIVLLENAFSNPQNPVGPSWDAELLARVVVTGPHVILVCGRKGKWTFIEKLEHLALLT